MQRRTYCYCVVDMTEKYTQNSGYWPASQLCSMKDVNRNSEKPDLANSVELGPESAERKGGGALTNAQNRTPRSLVVHFFTSYFC